MSHPVKQLFYHDLVSDATTHPNKRLYADSHQETRVTAWFVAITAYPASSRMSTLPSRTYLLRHRLAIIWQISLLFNIIKQKDTAMYERLKKSVNIRFGTSQSSYPYDQLRQERQG